MNIKTKIITQNIEIYECGNCNLVLKDEWAMKKHYVDKHAVQKYIKVPGSSVNGELLLKFQTQDDAYLWISIHSLVDFRYINWKGPGWYTYYESGNNGNLYSIDDWIYISKNKIKDLVHNIKAIQKAMKKEEEENGT